MAETKNPSTAAPATKMEAVERTLKELGSDTMPMAIKEHLKKRYGMEISANVASDYKKKLKQRAKAPATPEAAKPVATPEAAKPAAMPPVAQTPAPLKKAAAPSKKTVPSVKKVAAPKAQASVLETPKKANGTKGRSVLLDDVLTAKALLDRVGLDNLRTLIEGLAR